MVSQKVLVKNPSGFHMRPAGLLCDEAIKFSSSVSFRSREELANAKSVLSILGACVISGEEVEIICEGPDEEEALQAIVKLIEDGLGE